MLPSIRMGRGVVALLALAVAAGCTTVLGIDGDYHESATLSCAMEEPPVGGDCPEACSGGCEDAACLIDCGSFGSCREGTIACPDGFDCLEAGGGGACWPSDASGGGCCDASGNGAPTALFGLGFVALALRRRRRS